MKHLLLLLFSFIILFANQKISVQFEWKHQFEFAGFYAAKEQGYYDNIGLDVEFKEVTPSLNISDEIIAGNSEFGISSSSLILDKLQQKPVVLVASYFKQNVLALVVSPKIKTIKDLQNKKIMATKYEFEQTSLAVMLKEHNLTPDKYTLIKQDFGVEKFINGEIDAMSVFVTNQLYLLDKKNIPYNLLNPSDYGIYSYDGELFTSEKFAKKNPQLIYNFTQATNRGWEYAFAHKREIVELIHTRYNSSKSSQALMYEANSIQKLFKTNLFQIGSIVPELVELNAVIYKKLGLVSGDVAIKKILSNYIFNYNYDTPSNNEINFTDKELQYLKNHKTISIANEMDWAPFDYNEFGKAKGMSIEYIQLLLQKLDLKYRFVNGYTWSQLLKRFEEQKIDIIPAFYKSKERESFTLFTTPYHQGELALYVLKKNYRQPSSVDLKNKKIGIEESDASMSIVQKYFSNSKIIESVNSSTLFQNLLEKRVDAIVCNPLLAKHYLQTTGITNIKKVKKIELTPQEHQLISLHIGVNSQEPLLHSLLQKAINSLTQSEIESLQNRWIKEKQSSKSVLLNKEERDYLKSKNITMCIDPDWMPLESLKDGKHIGMSADFFTIIEKSIAKNIKVVQTSSWSESVALAKKRECDIFSLAMSTPKRQEYMNFTTPYLSIPLVLATNIDVAFVNDFGLLKNKKIGIPKNYAFAEILKNKYPNLTIIEVQNINDGLRKVKEGKLFGYIGTLASIAYIFQTDFIGELKITGKFDEEWRLGIGVRNDDPLLFNILQKAVNGIKEDKKREILNKWIAIRYEKGIDYTLAWSIFSIAILLLLTILYWTRKLSIINKELKKATITAEMATVTKANFLANMSHEIRTPMNSIVGMSYLLKETSLNKIQYDYIQKIETASNNLLSLINDILDFSKIEAHKLEIRDVNFNLLEVLNNVENILKIKSFEKELEFKITYDKSYSMHLYGDSMRLSQILINLLSNAIKFTEKGSVELLIEKQSSTLFRFSVIDTGIGLSQEQIETIFSSFTQADSSITRKYGGTGLGLAIAKELIELMNGSIWVNSTLGEGSSFIFEIDLKMSKESIAHSQVSNNEKVLTDLNKPLIPENKADELFLKLKECCQKRRPQLCSPILKEIDLYQLNETDTKLLESVKVFIKKYKFNEAWSLLNEK